MSALPDSEPTTPLDYALLYAQAGYRVIPIAPGKKYPDLKAWQDAATTDPTVIESWLTGLYKSHGLGLAMGEHQQHGHVFAVDIDMHDGIDGGAEWLDLCETYNYHDDLQQPTATTAGGGTHLLFASPQPITNANNLPDGIDIRGVGGQIVVEPSTLDGRSYHWVDGCEPWNINPPQAPGWLLALCERPAPQPTPRTPSTATGERPGDIYANQTTWADILGADGWTYDHTAKDSNGVDRDYWTRPGKPEGVSASTTADGLHCFTSSVVGLSADENYTKIGYLAAVHHNGDFAAATRALSAEGYQPEPIDIAVREPMQHDTEGSAEWETPIELTENDRPPFPTDIFPNAIRAQADQAAEEMQLAPDLAAQLALTALSIIAAGRVQIKVDGRHKEPCHLYSVTALPPSSGKSPTFSMMLGPLDQWEEKLVEEASHAIDDRNVERKLAEKEYNDAIKQGDATRAKIAADDLRERLEVIHTPRLMADDATPEKLVELLSQQNGRMALVSTEGGLFGMMTGRYSDKSNLDVYLGAWSGDTIRVDRIERGSTIVRRPALTVGLTVQPTVLTEVGKNRELVGRGLTARFMYSLPADTVGGRDKQRQSTYSDATEAAYARTLLDIIDRVDAATSAEPLRLELDTDARSAFKQWQAQREAQLGPYAPLRYMAEWVAKCDSSTARLAGLLHIASGNTNPLVGVETLQAAIRVGNYWTDHARAVFDIMGASEDLNLAQHILGWLRHRNSGTEITFSDVQQHAKKRVQRSHELVQAVEILVENGWLKPLTAGPLDGLIGKGKPSPRFLLHPSIAALSDTSGNERNDTSCNIDGDDGDNGDQPLHSNGAFPINPHYPHHDERNDTSCNMDGDNGDNAPRRSFEPSFTQKTIKDEGSPKPGPLSPSSSETIFDDERPEVFSDEIEELFR